MLGPFGSTFEVPDCADYEQTGGFSEGILEAPPGFEPGMEVLQTSALPLGDGAGRNWGSKLTWNGPAASRDADDSDERRE